MRAALLAILTATACGPTTHAVSTRQFRCRVVHAYPHDRSAFTEGLFYDNGFLYEGTGEYGQSDIRKVKLETGEVVQRHVLPGEYFGEGIIKWRDRLIELEWKGESGFIYDFKTFNLIRRFHYPGQGWSLTTDGKRIIMDDGTAEIRFWDPETLAEQGRITVTDQGRPIDQLNELEWVKGEILANIWMTDKIARIDPATGHINAWIDCSGLLAPSEHIPDGPLRTDFLNGIAYDARGGRLFVTGKRWPKLFQVDLVEN